ncbi:unnamed protein product, partial [Prorocentrum cordatum]
EAFARSDADSSHDGSTGSSYGRSWADQSEDTWPDEQEDAAKRRAFGGATRSARALPPRSPSEPPAGGTAAGAGHQVCEQRRLPGFGDRLEFGEFFPPSSPVEPRKKEKATAPLSNSTRRRKQRQLADKRAAFRELNQDSAPHGALGAPEQDEEDDEEEAGQQRPGAACPSNSRTLISL